MIPEGDGVLDARWLSTVLDASPAWAHGAVRVIGASRIGADHGLSGRAHRVVAETERGGRRSLVVKQESAEAVERELLFHREMAESLRGSIPACHGAAIDRDGDRGVLLLEDVAPAEQGDVLGDCTDEQAEAVVRIVARVHGTSWRPRDDAFPVDLPRWAARPMEAGTWTDRLMRARERFPEILTGELSARVGDVAEQVAVAIEQLRAGPATWIHVDAHLDNVLWRPDGSAVLLDWCGARIGPPAVDLARCLTEGLDAGSRPERAAAAMSAYVQELRRCGVPDVDAEELWNAFAHALGPLLQSAVGWAGRPEEREPDGRMAALRENMLRSACAWFSGPGAATSRT